MIDRILNLIRSARIRLVDDTGVVQQVQADEGPVAPTGERRIIDRVKMIGLYGFWSVPPVGSEVLLAAAAGDRSRSFGVGTNHQESRPTGGQPGDSGLYDDRGRRFSFTDEGVVLDAGGAAVLIRNAADVRIESSTSVTIVAAEKITLDAPLVQATHDLHVAGALDVDGAITGAQAVYSRGGDVELSALRDIYHSHTHGGVKAGTDQSAGPTQAD